MDSWINTIQYIHTVEYHSSTKRKEILTHATTWMNLDNIMLNETSESKRQIPYDSTYMRFLE